jgi:pimeloyl-ACP methyl ester carboxylesterase
MSDVVLVHGAWQGGWCWERVTPLLEDAGHRVVAPTLTGCGDRAAEMTPDVELETHVADVERTLGDCGDDVVLVGHSYAGMVISAAVERSRGAQVSALVYVDAFYPNAGESALEQMPPPFQELFRRRAQDEGDGWRLPANDGLLDVWGLHDEHDRGWVRARLSDWSLRCFTSPLRDEVVRRRHLTRRFVSATKEGYPAREAFAALAARAEADGCSLTRVDTGHDVMIEAPEQLARVIASFT